MRRLLPLIAFAVIAAACGSSGEQGASSTLDISAPTTIPQSSTQPPDPGTTGTTSPSSSPTQTPAFESAACRFDVPSGYSADCGYLSVPEDRSDEDSPMIRLHVAVFPAASDSPAPEPLVYLDGGPGGETLETLEFVFEDNFVPFLQERDVVLFDQRGVGFSEPSLACPENRELSKELLDDDLSSDEYIALEFVALEECRDRLVADGVNLAAYNSAENAADVADLRRALGYESWNILGVSYGTRLALTVMRDDAEGVRSVILDSTYPPQQSLLETPSSFDRALDTLFSSCAEDAACAAEYPDLEDRFFALANRLEANPVIISIRDVFDGTSRDALLDGTGLIGLFFQGLYSEQIIPLLPRVVDEVENESYSTISLMASNAFANGEFISLGMHVSVQCHEEIPFTTEEQLVAAIEPYPELDEFFAGSTNTGRNAPGLCELWPAGFGGAVENQPVVSELPTLVLAGQFDPITPPSWGEEAAETLANSYFFEFPSVGHGASFSGECPLSVAQAFLREPARQPDGSCIDTMGPVAFVPEPIDTASLNLIPFESDQFGGTMIGVVPEGWDEAGNGVWVRGADSLDQTAILQQIAPGDDAASVASLFLSTFAGGQDIETSTVSAGGKDWTMWRDLDIDGYVGDIAARAESGNVLIVLVLATAAEHDDIFDALLLPALEAAAVR